MIRRLPAGSFREGDARRLATLDCLPASVRESGIGVDGTHAYVPTRDGRLLTLALSPTGMSVSGVPMAFIRCRAWRYSPPPATR